MNFKENAEKLNKRYRKKKRWQKAVAVLGCIVVFCTVYALILPAVTLDGGPYCGLSEHTHTEECYASPPKTLVCTETEHTHTDECRDEDGNIICGFSAHTHTDECYEISGDAVLICDKTEHIHTDACFEKPEETEAIDVSNGPVINITAMPKRTVFRLTAAKLSLYAAANTATDLTEYIEQNGGTYFFTLTDNKNQELPKDGNGNFIVTAGQSYKLTMSINLPNGIAPGEYRYQLPEGLSVNGGSGEFYLKNEGVTVGTWTVTDDGLITFVFNGNANKYSDMIISATMGTTFNPSDNPIIFDGKISVIIENPPEEETYTELSKWERDQSKIADADPDKIYWELEIVGGTASNIIGGTLNDTVYTQNGITHHYTESDMAAGIRIEAYLYDDDGNNIDEHKYVVYPGDENLTWTETGWSYVFPETFYCDWCGSTASSGNNNWIYYIKYTSTTTDAQENGYAVYRNTVTIDGAEAEGWVRRQKGESSAEIIKEGTFRGDDNGGKFIWTVTATIPGLKDGQKAAYFWHLWDSMKIKSIDGADYAENHLGSAEVKAHYQGNTITVPSYADATSDDMFCWENSWSSVKNGVAYGQEIDFYCRCMCTEETCTHWENGECTDKRSKGFCKCWAVPDDVVFTFQYYTPANELLETYDGKAASLINYVSLDQQQYDETEGRWKNVAVADTTEEVQIPGVFEKKLTQDYNGHIAKYTITVNEAMLKLTDGSPLTIHDIMSDTLAYINGSLTVTTVDADGYTETLTYGDDYTVQYDGSGNVTDEATGKPVHVLDIVIQKPQAVKYTLTYDATLIIPAGATESVKYSNYAKVTLYGKDIISESEEKIYADINISAKNYKVEIIKTDSETGLALAGAKFGFYNASGGLISSGETDENSSLMFETDISNGVILQEHTPYYIQEISAPPKYITDNTKHWFFFCDSAENCTECDTLLSNENYPGIIRIQGKIKGEFQIANEPTSYELPETGGNGTYLYTVGGLLLSAVALMWIFDRRRKNERRTE